MSTHVVRGCALLIVFGVCVGALAQTTGPQVPPLVIQSLVGRDLFDFYCASCHGRGGKGDGPIAEALRVPPPDLTQLTRRNQGTFPRQRVEAFITNDGQVLSAAHGRSEMPVWGPVFRALDPSDTRVKIRIANVVDYVASMQAK